MARPTAMTGRRIIHLRLRTMSKYSPILRGRNSAIELLPNSSHWSYQSYQSHQSHQSYGTYGTYGTYETYKVAKVLRASLASAKFVFSPMRRAVSICLRAPALSPLAESATPRW